MPEPAVRRTMTNPISSLPGLGPKSQAMLALAGIVTVDALRRLGSVQAYVMVNGLGASPA